nr:BON domain-containing protein [uncultured bacterium]
MSNRYDDRDYDRGEQNYGRRRDTEHDRSYRGQSQDRYRDDDRDWEAGLEREYRSKYSSAQGGRRSYRDEYGGRYSQRGEQGYGEYRGRYSSRQDRETDLGGDYNARYSPTQGREGAESSGRYSSGRDYGYAGNRSQSDWDHSGERDRSYGDHNRTYDDEGRYGESRNYSQRLNYPTRSRTGEGYAGRSWSEYERGQYGRRQERDYQSGRGDYGSPEDRGWWDRASDEVASWFGDKEAERRRQMDQQRQLRGRGPKGYRRSDERIKEDVNDRLSDGYLDASDIEVSVAETEVTLTGSVNTREDKRVAEDIAESVSGVTNVENRLRVKQSSLDRPFIGTAEKTESTGPVDTMGSSTGTSTSTGTGTTGTSTNRTTGTGTSTSATGTGGSSTSATGTGRGRGAGS